MRKFILAPLALSIALITGVTIGGALPTFAQTSRAVTTTGVIYLRSIFAGAGTATYTPSGPIFTSITPASNTSTTETDLITYSLPANTLSTNGQKVRVIAWGTVANNGDAKTVAVYFGAQKYTPISGVTIANANWHIEMEIIRTGAATQQTLYVRGSISNSGAFLAGLYTNPTETLSGAVTIKVTGQSGTGSNDVTANGMYVEWRAQ